MKIIIRTLCTLSLLALPCIATAEPIDLAATGSVEFGFADWATPLPAGVSLYDVVTIATEKKGEHFEGVILLVDGRVIHFTGTHSQPLEQDAQALLESPLTPIAQRTR